MKDKEWLKKETEKLYKHDEAYLNPDDIVVENYQTVTSILELIDQLEEPEITDPTISKKETVEVPDFVNKWIKRRKKEFKSAHQAILYIDSFGWDDETHVEYKIYKWLPDNLMMFCKAWDNVPAPKTLQVIIKNYDSTVFTTELPEDEARKLIEGWKG